MPAERPGRRYSVIATKVHSHGAPACELNHAGIAAKSTPPAPAAPSVANAALAVVIAIGEEFVVMLDGSHDVPVAALPGGTVASTQLWIDPADDTLKSGGGGSRVKFGVVDEIDTVRGVALVNLSQRSSF